MSAGRLTVSVLPGAGVRFGRWFGVTFQRTLRVPDDGRLNRLPPGLGPLPVYRVEDHAARVPRAWREGGGVFLPLYQREALWIGFDAEAWRPHAVKVAVGGLNALTGEPWERSIDGQRQDYMVCPPQLWIDGIKVGPGEVRQFVAMPLGGGLTVEAQLTGEERYGGLEMMVYPPRPGLFPEHPPPEPEMEPTGPPVPMRGPPPGDLPPMGIAAGGLMEQKIYPDPHGPGSWDQESAAELRVHLVNSEQFREITGEEPPPTPVSARSYTEHGLPWFSLWDEAMGDVQTAERLSAAKSLKALETERGESHDTDEEAGFTVREDQTIRLDPGPPSQASRRRPHPHPPPLPGEPNGPAEEQDESRQEPGEGRRERGR